MEKSSGAIIYRYEKNNIYYLLLRYQSQAKKGVDYWGFPKGHIEGAETEKETVVREIFEEAGLSDLIIRKGFRYLIRYRFRKEGKLVSKTVSFYIAETRTKEVKVSFEHIGYQWIKFDRALKELHFENDKKLLKQANKFILKK